MPVLVCMYVILGVSLVFNFLERITLFGSLSSYILSFMQLMQYLLFFVLFNTPLPPQADDLVGFLWRNTIGLRNNINNVWLINNRKQDPVFSKELDDSTTPKLSREGLSFYFLLNFTLPAIIQILFVIYYTIVKLLRKLEVKLRRDKLTTEQLKNTLIKKKIDSLEFEGFILVTFSFIIEMIVYCVINLTNLLGAATTKTFQASTYIAMLYFIGIVIFIILFIKITGGEVENLKSKTWYRKWGILYSKYKLEHPIGRRLRIIYFIFSFVYGFLLAVCLSNGVLQSLLTLANILVYTGLVYFFNPFVEKVQFYIKLAQNGLLILLHLLVMMFCIDDATNFMAAPTRNVLGWFWVILFTAAFSLRLVLLARQLVLNIWNFVRCKKVDDENIENNNPDTSKPQKAEADKKTVTGRQGPEMTELKPVQTEAPKPKQMDDDEPIDSERRFFNRNPPQTVNEPQQGRPISPFENHQGAQTQQHPQEQVAHFYVPNNQPRQQPIAPEQINLNRVPQQSRQNPYAPPPNNPSIPQLQPVKKSKQQLFDEMLAKQASLS